MLEVRFLPHSAKRITVSAMGDVAYMGKELEKEMCDGKYYVRLQWLSIESRFEVALLVMVAFGMIDLPEHLWDEIEPLYKDGDPANLSPVNLTYRFVHRPLEVSELPGYYYIPFHCRYAINKNGDVVNIASGHHFNWWRTKPDVKRNSRGGYHGVRVVAGTMSTMLYRHRAMALTFLEYDETINTKVVNHLNGEPSDDRVSNLEWTTYSSNNEHAVEFGLRSTVKRVSMLRLRTGETVSYRSIGAAANALRMTRTTVRRRLKVGVVQGEIPPDGLLFRYDRGPDTWKDVEGVSIKPSPAYCKIVARNVFTGDLITFDNAQAASAVLGIRLEAITSHLSSHQLVPTEGFNFRYVSEHDDFPVHSSRHLEIYRKYPTHPPDGVIVVDLQTGEEKFYLSRQEASEATGVHPNTVNKMANSKAVWKGQYRFEHFKLRERLSPPRE